MINILVLLILFYVDYTSSKKLFNIHKYGKENKSIKGAWAHSTEIKIHCFSGDSSIRLSNGENKNISYLKSGDEILTIDQSKIVSTEMIMMLDKQISTEVVFYKLITKSGHEISLTEYHLIPILNSNQNQIYLFAKQIQIGDFLYVVSNDLLNYSPVINITVEIKKGYYAPLTIKGTLLVNDVLANNLNEDQEKTLKYFWISLIEKITNESNVTLEKFLDSKQGKELFYSFSLDNPDVVLLRFLRARKWNIDLALEQLIETLEWRTKSNLEQLIANGESQLHYGEILTGKTFYVGYDKVGRPINYVSTKDHIKGQFPPEATEKYTILAMEVGRKLLHSPVESVTIILDMNGFSMRNMDYQHAQFLVNLLQNYYPESLGIALIVNAPKLFYGCWHIIKSWLDPVVRNKIHFLNNLDDLTEYIDLSNLPKRLNGNQQDFNYIPPTEQEKKMLSAFRNDFHGIKKAKENYQRASINYLRITYEWAQSKMDQNILEQRKQATEQLRHAYEQFIPYISSKTHYHRNRFISEPIFDITYQNIQQENQRKVVHF
ncbi:unnamed protein product [Rotaria magnacalcarata]|uniref:CRAL-TRIO domain-containing protein n=1 Tax=Rotaria magnacalcarata TaxID=392030 RepID=A0A8S2JF12_9BILA|nr:unnamed protein product [Rotaria magnacalcarata]